MHAEINREGCIGCGICADTCPEVFRMDDDNKAEAYAAITPDVVDAANEAAESCPVSVITIVD